MGLFGKKRKKQHEQVQTSNVVKEPGVTYRVVRGTYRNFLNAPRWASYDFIKEQSLGVFSLLKFLFRKRYAEREETFEQAMLRLNLTESDIKVRYKQVRFQFWLYAGIAAVIFAYAVYLLITTTLLVSVLAFLVSGICALRALGMRFWMFQIRKRRLGCSFREWIGRNKTLREGS